MCLACYFMQNCVLYDNSAALSVQCLVMGSMIGIKFLTKVGNFLLATMSTLALEHTLLCNAYKG